MEKERKSKKIQKQERRGRIKTGKESCKKEIGNKKKDYK